jgi:hypothetical protein
MRVEVVDIPTTVGRKSYNEVWKALLDLPPGRALKVEGVISAKSRQNMLCALRARTKYHWPDGSIMFRCAVQDTDGLTEIYIWLAPAGGSGV